mmetsp:Transcript_60318/g.118245  ORF Transcript_60318/g.118245 Transcript_60318/m.118245 type:complete len:245 (-) Transcript_60318:39-773(-)
MGGQNEGPETHPDREIIMATLSTAMVGPMDGIGFLNASRVMTSCRLDGIVLKPDHPQKTVDTCFRKGQPRLPEECFLFATVSALVGLPKPIHYLFDNNPRITGGILPDMLQLATADVEGGKYVVFNWYSGGVVAWINGEKPLVVVPGYENHAYAVVSPVVNGIAFLGEYQSKYVPCSSLRFPSVIPDPSGAAELTITVVGVAKEDVQVCAATMNDGGGWVVACKSTLFVEGGSLNVSLGLDTKE